MDDGNRTQVLSISYGAFSIRLEGYGDPFPIMKRVTEYFRQIATTDRTFGTLPIEKQHLEMDGFARAMRAEGTAVEMSGDQVRLSPTALPREEGKIPLDAPANAGRAPSDFYRPEPTAEEIAEQKRIEVEARAAAEAAAAAAEAEAKAAKEKEERERAEAAALTKAMAETTASMERDDEIKRRLKILRGQTTDISDKYDIEDTPSVGYPFLKSKPELEEDELIFEHPLRSRFKKLRLQTNAQMTGTDGGTRLKLSPEMRTIKVSKS